MSPKDSHRKPKLTKCARDEEKSPSVGLCHGEDFELNWRGG